MRVAAGFTDDFLALTLHMAPHNGGNQKQKLGRFNMDVGTGLVELGVRGGGDTGAHGAEQGVREGTTGPRSTRGSGRGMT